MSSLESERIGIGFQAFGIFWFLVAGIGQGIFDAITAPYLLWAPVLCAGSGAYIWWLGRKDRHRAREHHAFMEDHRRRMANFGQRDKAIWS